MLALIAKVKADVLALEGFLSVAGPVGAKAGGFAFGVVEIVAKAALAGVVAVAKSLYGSVVAKITGKGA